jgi:hypothetical protein
LPAAVNECEHSFVGDAGTASGRFSRAIAHGDLLGAEAAARELGGLSLDYALDLLILIAAQRDPRFPRAAVRWLSRLLSERELELDEVGLAASSLVALQGRTARDAVALLEELTRRPRPKRPLAITSETP